jgi:acetylornithine deacetylase/succinyl-diaminopimelate desuccinylase-like protein
MWLREHRPVLTRFSDTYGFHTDPMLPAIAAMRKGFEDAMGTPGIVANWIAQCDGDSINPYVPCVVFGPQPPGAHAPNERITLKELLDCVKVFASTAMEHCK